MFRNYFLTAWRALARNKVFSVLNLLGLSIGMAVALVIGLWVHYQYSFDRFWPNYHEIYDARIRFTKNGETHSMQASPLPLSDALKKDIPGIEYAAHTDWMNGHGLVVGKNKVFLAGAMAEDDFFKIFPCRIVKGSLAYPQKNIYTIVLTESTAKALFGDGNPIGHTVRIDNKQDLTVTAIIHDLPVTSSLSFDYVIPFAYKAHSDSWVSQSMTDWSNNSFATYVKLKPGVSYAQVEPRLKTMLDGYVTQTKEYKETVFFHPLKDWHLFGDFTNGYVSGGFINYVRLFSLIGILVLLIACVNFMNLSTARSEKRAREVGVRKAIGSLRKDLIIQFLIESLVVTAIAAGFSLILTELALPAFNQLTDSHVVIPWASFIFWAAMIGYVFITGTLAGSRPAFYLSSFRPVEVLKGKVTTGAAPAWPRKLLVVMQFSCSIALIISTFLIYQQVNYAKSRPAGYDSNRLVMSGGSADLNRNYPALRDEVLKTGVVESITRSSSFVTGLWNWTTIQDWPGRQSEEGFSLASVEIGEAYFKTLGMQLLAGRNFSEDAIADSSSVILNESAVKALHLKDAVNQIIVWHHSPHRVIAVVKDALMGNPYYAANAVLFNFTPSEANNITYRLAKNADVASALAQLGAIFNKYNPAYPFDYRFVDESYARKFGLEVLVGKLAALFAGLAIFISCLGLFGLAAYTAEQRTREIGIRKVLGANVAQLWLLLSKDFVVLVLVSCVVASPIAYYFLDQWLHTYNYRITIGAGVFLAAAGIALAITVLTVSFQSVRAAMANPTKSLRSE